MIGARKAPCSFILIRRVIQTIRQKSAAWPRMPASSVYGGQASRNDVFSANLYALKGFRFVWAPTESEGWCVPLLLSVNRTMLSLQRKNFCRYFPDGEGRADFYLDSITDCHAINSMGEKLAGTSRNGFSRDIFYDQSAMLMFQSTIFQNFVLKGINLSFYHGIL